MIHMLWPDLNVEHVYAKASIGLAVLGFIPDMIHIPDISEAARQIIPILQVCSLGMSLVLGSMAYRKKKGEQDDN